MMNQDVFPHCRGFTLATALVAGLALAFPGALAAQQHSLLWGENGELWDPGTSRLRNFTEVGYRAGAEPIPDWPVGVNVTDFGAIPGDGEDDSAAFLAAIAACPDYHAVFVPEGRYLLQQQLRIERSHFVLRGESMYGSVLYFPKNLVEIYAGSGSSSAYLRKGFFFAVSGWEGIGVEQLSFVFRNQTKMGHWEMKGADAIGIASDDSWVRDVYIENADHNITVWGEHNSVLNVVMDHSIDRPDDRGRVAHVGIGFTSEKSLFHNTDIHGRHSHAVDISQPRDNVISNIKGSPRLRIHHHAPGSRRNLYTNAEVGSDSNGVDGAGIGDTHWRIFGDQRLGENRSWKLDRDNLFVAFDGDLETTETETFYYESIAPGAVQPQNIYLAQLAYFDKPLPPGPPAPPPRRGAGDVVRSVAAELRYPYLKFDLRDLDLGAVRRARLKVNIGAWDGSDYQFTLASVDDDSWTSESVEAGERPAAGPVMDGLQLSGQSNGEWLELDATSFVAAQVAADGIISLKLEASGGRGYLRDDKGINRPRLVIEEAADPVPGAPSAPTGVQTISADGGVIVDWADNPEADIAYYNLYRGTGVAPGTRYSEVVAMDLALSEYEDFTRTTNRSWADLRPDETYFYLVTAVDRHFNESAPSAVFVGTTHDAGNAAPAFRESVAATRDLALGSPMHMDLGQLASDPEADDLYFFKVSGPAWLQVALDGTVTGTPGPGDLGASEVVIQVNARGGRDQLSFTAAVFPEMIYRPTADADARAIPMLGQRTLALLVLLLAVPGILVLAGRRSGGL